MKLKEIAQRAKAMLDNLESAEDKKSASVAWGLVSQKMPGMISTEILKRLSEAERKAVEKAKKKAQEAVKKQIKSEMEDVEAPEVVKTMVEKALSKLEK